MDEQIIVDKKKIQSQKKNQKRKEKRKLEKLKEKEVPKDEVIDLQEAEVPNTEEILELEVENLDLKYENELEWCISQLEAGIKSAKNTEQISESKKVIAKLRSTSYPKPGKRSLMRVVFGDYRTRMKEESIL